MPYNCHPNSLEITLREFLTKVLWAEELSSPIEHSLTLNLFEVLPPGVREVKVIIKQVENFIFFRVENTVDHDPFMNNSSLTSTKTDTSTQHGLGLKNISDIADKYSGFLRSEYKDGHFISVVSLCYEPLDT